MELAKLPATLKEETSSKSGKPYVYVSIMLTPTYEMKAFPDNAEKELIKMFLNKNNKEN